MNSTQWSTLVNDAAVLLETIGRKDETGTRTKLTDLTTHVERYLPKPAAKDERPKAPDYFCVGGKCGLGRHVACLDPPEEDGGYGAYRHRVPMAMAGTSGGTEGFKTEEEAFAFYNAVKDAMEHAP